MAEQQTILQEQGGVNGTFSPKIQMATIIISAVAIVFFLIAAICSLIGNGEDEIPKSIAEYYGFDRLMPFFVTTMVLQIVVIAVARYYKKNNWLALVAGAILPLLALGIIGEFLASTWYQDCQLSTVLAVSASIAMFVPLLVITAMMFLMCQYGSQRLKSQGKSKVFVNTATVLLMAVGRILIGLSCLLVSGLAILGRLVD